MSDPSDNDFALLYPRAIPKTASIATMALDPRAVLRDGRSLAGISPPRCALQSARGKRPDVLFDHSFSTAGYLIVSPAFATFLKESPERSHVELVPITLEGAPPRFGIYSLVVLCNAVDAFDQERSVYTRFDEPGPSGVRPIRDIERLVIDPDRTGGRRLFSMVGFEGHIFVRRDFVVDMHTRGLTGWQVEPLRGRQLPDGIPLRLP